MATKPYEAVFRDNAVDAEVLFELSDSDLAQLGVLLGHRKRLLKAIAELAAAGKIAPPTRFPLYPLGHERRARAYRGGMHRRREMVHKEVCRVRERAPGI